MNPHDAQRSLNDLHRLQDRTREEYVRHGFARPYLLFAALAMFVMGATPDLPSPWNNAAVVSVCAALLVGMLIMHRRAPVRRTPTGLELLFYAGWGACAMVVYIAANLAAALATLAFGLPAPHVFAAAALALTIVVTAGWTRRMFEAVLRQEGRRG